MTPSVMMLLAVVVVALWVLFSGGTPAIKFIIYRAVFVAFAVVASVFTVQTFSASGMGPAILVAIALTVAWSMFVGPIVSTILNFRKNPKKLAHTAQTSQVFAAANRFSPSNG